MKISIFIKGLAGVTGGAEKSALHLASALQSVGHHVEVVTYDGFDGPPYYPVPDAVHVLNLRKNAKPLPAEKPEQKQDGGNARKKAKKKVLSRAIKQLRLRLLLTSSRLRKLDRKKRFRKIVRALDEYAKHAKPDVCIAFMNGMGIPVAMSSELAKSRRIYSFRKTPAYEFEFDIKDIGRRLDGTNLHECLPAYDAITVLVPAYIDLLAPSLRPKITYIPNDLPPNSPSTGAFAPLSERAKRILFVGRLIQSKRPKDLLLAWRDIAADYPDWELAFYGKGGEAAEMASLIEQHQLGERCKLMGLRSDIANVLNDAQIFGFPSQFEGFPRALGEAMQAGLACVGYDDCDGSVHLLNQSGLLAKAEIGVEDLSAKLRALLDSEDLRQDIANKGQEAVQAFSTERVQSNWLDLIQQVQDAR